MPSTNVFTGRAGAALMRLPVCCAAVGLFHIIDPASPASAQDEQIETLTGAHAQEITRACARAGEILTWIDAKRTSIRQAHVACMAGTPLSADGGETWTESRLHDTFDGGARGLRVRFSLLEFIPNNWYKLWQSGSGYSYSRDDAPPPDWRVTDVPARSHPDELLKQEDIPARAMMTRMVLDDLILSAISELWYDRIALSGFAESEWGEVDAIATELQRRLQPFRDELAALPLPPDDADDETWAAFNRDRRQLAERLKLEEQPIIEDPALTQRLQAITPELEALRRECAEQLNEWRQFVAQQYAAQGPEGELRYRNGLAWQIEELLQRHFMTHGEDTTRLELAIGTYDDRILVEGADYYELIQRPAFMERVPMDVRAEVGEVAAIGHKNLVEREPDRTPHIAAVVVVRRDAAQKAPAGENVNVEVPGATLAVFGRNLVNDRGAVAHAIESDSGRIRYEAIHALAGAWHRLEMFEADPYRTLYDEAVTLARTDVPSWEGEWFELLDVVLVEASMDAGLVPQLLTCRMGAAEGLWTLTTATTSGAVEFIRPRPARLANEADHPAEVFIFDRFIVQIETEHELEVDELPIVVLRNDEPLALRQSGDESADGILIARKVQGFPRLLQTLPIVVEDADPTTAHLVRPGTHYVSLGRGDVLRAMTDGPLFEVPGSDAVNVLLTPAEIRTTDGKTMHFTEAIVDAARIHDVELANLNVADDLVVDDIRHTIVFNWQVHDIDFTLTDHAAMLLMKRTFISMAEERLRALEAIFADPARIQAHVPTMHAQFRAWARMRDESVDEHGLGSGRIFVPPLLKKSVHLVNAEGLTTSGREEFDAHRWQARPGHFPLTWAFNDNRQDQYFATEEAWESFRFQATREALRLQVEETRAAIEHARDVDDDDVEELLELVGRGFEPVIDRILPRLLALESDRVNMVNAWVPRERARDAIINLQNTLAEHEVAEAGAREDTEAILAVLSSFGMGVTFKGMHVALQTVGKSILAATSALSVGVAVNDVLDLERDKAETEFARNAMEIIGRDRFDFDFEHHEFGVMPYVALGLNVLGFRFDIADAVQVVRLSQARTVAERWMPHVGRDGFDAMAEIPLKDKSVVYMLIREAEDMRQAGKILTPAHEEALRAGEMLDRQLASGPGGWVVRYDEPRIADSASPARNSLEEATTLADDAPPADDTFRAAATEPDSDALRADTELEGDALREAETEIDHSAPAADGALADSSVADAIAGMSDDARRAIVRRLRKAPLNEIPLGMPTPGYLVDVPGTTEKYVVGDPIAVGSFATVYELLDSTRAPTGKVIKFLRNPWDFEYHQWLKEIAAGQDVRVRELDGMQIRTWAPFDATPLPEMADRMTHGGQLLSKAGIPHLAIDIDTPLAAAGRDTELTFVVQDAIKTDGTFAMFGAKAPPTDPALLAAVAKLYKQIAEAGLIWKDGHIENIYFRFVNNEWVAGVLDPDMIVHWDEAVANEFLRREITRPFVMVSAPGFRGVGSVNEAEEFFDAANRFATEAVPLPEDIHRQLASSPHEFMAKMFEHKAWITYQRSYVAGQSRFEDGIMPVQIVRDHFGEIEQWVTYTPLSNN